MIFLGKNREKIVLAIFSKNLNSSKINLKIIANISKGTSKNIPYELSVHIRNRPAEWKVLICSGLAANQSVPSDRLQLNFLNLP